ncbi:c-type cytochrome [Methyloversatilis discipulorum]|uniref:c-type cytochrome n=1 Tax=Methyloversatilis discipulorum TaxID=1119528 RepID=UPI001A455489|nr:cytochrome c [Methyloversatilis discipulorum]MBL8467110.1 cytochrome c [Methyloversatilis discipulorum]
MALATTLLLAGCAGKAMNTATASPHARPSALGTPIVEPDLVAWNIDVRGPDGQGLPPGSGNARTGKAVFDAQCASCHGAAAAGGPMFGTMVGGIGSFKTDKRVLTPGSMYPYAPALFDYIRRAMPLTAPQSLSSDQTYAVTAYLLHLNGLVGQDAEMNAASLAAIRMPNRDGFIVDDRPDTNAVRCMQDCKPLRTSVAAP